MASFKDKSFPFKQDLHDAWVHSYLHFNHNNSKSRHTSKLQEVRMALSCHIDLKNSHKFLMNKIDHANKAWDSISTISQSKFVQKTVKHSQSIVQEQLVFAKYIGYRHNPHTKHLQSTGTEILTATCSADEKWRVVIQGNCITCRIISTRGSVDLTTEGLAIMWGSPIPPYSTELQ